MADLRRSARQAELRRAERFLTVDRFRADAVVAAAIFIVSVACGTMFYARYVRQGGHPFFYQTYFEPAVMTACGHGFVISRVQPPALREFLLERTDRFSCDQLPATIEVSPNGPYQRPWRYLLTTVAAAWRVLGISWSGLAPLFGLLYGATTTAAYALFRLLAGRAAAAAACVFLCFSRLQLSNLPNLRDYAKAPFTVALLAILVALALKPRSLRATLGLSVAYGVVLGIGYGFRTDLLVDIPPFLVTLLLFLPGGVFRRPAAKAAAVALFALAFAVAAAPILTAVTTRGGCQWHFFLLGLSDPFDSSLGIRNAAYSFGRLYKDESVWAAVSSFAHRIRPDAGYIDYCSHEYDVASWEYLRTILVAFPADMVTRAYASVLHVLDVPIHRVPGLGPVAAAAFVVMTAAWSVRLSLFALFVILYFTGVPAVQFLPRHYFPFEVIPLAILAFFLDRAAAAALDGTKLRELRTRVAGHRRDVAVCAVVCVAVIGVPIASLRAYQNGRVKAMLRSYVEADKAPAGLEPVAPGRFSLPGGGHHRRSDIEKVESLASGRMLLLDVELDATACRIPTTVVFRYDDSYALTDLTHEVAVATAADGGSTHLIEPVYEGFVGLDISDPRCVPRAFVVRGMNPASPLLPALLPPGWDSRPLYQQIAHLQ